MFTFPALKPRETLCKENESEINNIEWNFYFDWYPSLVLTFSFYLKKAIFKKLTYLKHFPQRRY